jgi:hypothetical protein
MQARHRPSDSNCYVSQKTGANAYYSQRLINMTKYQIEIVEEVTYMVDVEAESEEQAVKAVNEGEIDYAYDFNLVESSVTSVIAKGSNE